MFSTAKTAALAIAAAGMAFTVPAAAAPASHGAATSSIPASVMAVQPVGDMQFEHGRKKHKHYKRGRGYRQDYQAQRRADRRYQRQAERRYERQYDRRYNQPQRAYYGERVNRNTRVWRDDRDGRLYCRRSNGTTGLLIGGAAGALLGREIAGRGDRTLGAILGAAGGALLGREIDSGNARCR